MMDKSLNKNTATDRFDVFIPISRKNNNVTDRQKEDKAINKYIGHKYVFNQKYTKDKYIHFLDETLYITIDDLKCS